VNPLESTSTVPTPGTDAVETVVDPAWAGEPPPPPVVLEAVLFAHPDRSISATMGYSLTGRTLRRNTVTSSPLEASRPQVGRGDRSLRWNYDQAGLEVRSDS
jgi:hypothetical protein